MQRLARPRTPAVYAFHRTEGADTVTVFLNFGSAPAIVDGLPGAARDAFDGEVAAPGSPLTLSPRGYRVLLRAD
jgi:hypothetical protein